MKDRIVEHPGRFRLTPVPGEDGVYDLVAVPGTVTEEGTALNKATLLSDETAGLFGLTGNRATINDALLSCVKTIPHYKAFTADGSFIVPAGIEKIVIYACAAGKGTNAGQYINGESFSVKPGVQLNVRVGTGDTILSGTINRTLTAGVVTISLNQNFFGLKTGVAGIGGEQSNSSSRLGASVGGAFGYGGGGGGGNGYKAHSGGDGGKGADIAYADGTVVAAGGAGGVGINDTGTPGKGSDGQKVTVFSEKCTLPNGVLDQLPLLKQSGAGGGGGTNIYHNAGASGGATMAGSGGNGYVSTGNYSTGFGGGGAAGGYGAGAGSGGAATPSPGMVLICYGGENYIL